MKKIKSNFALGDKNGSWQKFVRKFFSQGAKSRLMAHLSELIAAQSKKQLD